MGLKLQSSGGGSVELVAPVTASNFTQTVPAESGAIVVDDSAAKTANATSFTADSGFYLNNQTIGTSRTIPTGYSAMSAGPVYVQSGITVTVASGARWAVV